MISAGERTVLRERIGQAVSAFMAESGSAHWTSYAFRLRPGPDFSTDYCVQIVRVKMTSGRAETAGVRAIQRRPDVGGEILTSLRAPTTDMRARLARSVLTVAQDTPCIDPAFPRKRPG